MIEATRADDESGRGPVGVRCGDCLSASDLCGGKVGTRLRPGLLAPTDPARRDIYHTPPSLAMNSTILTPNLHPLSLSQMPALLLESQGYHFGEPVTGTDSRSVRAAHKRMGNKLECVRDKFRRFVLSS